MLDKELAQATRMAEQAHKKVEQLRKRIVAESEKTQTRLKRELNSARKQHTAASARLKRAQTSLRKQATPANRKKVDQLVAQVQDLADSIVAITRAAYESAEQLVVAKADALVVERRARAASQAATVMERALAGARTSAKKTAKKKTVTKKKASAKKKTATKKKASAKKKAPAKKKASVKKKAPAKKKAATKRKSAPAKKSATKKKAPARKTATPKKRTVAGPTTA